MAKAKKQTKQEQEMGADNVTFEEGSGVVDLSGIDEDVKFEVIPRGKYPGVVSAVSFEFSQSSGNPMFSWELEIESGEYKGRKLFYHTVFKGAQGALARTKRTLKIVAPNLVDAQFDPQEVADEGSLLGARVTIVVDIKPYQGEKRNNVKDLLPPTEGGEDFLEGA